MKNLLSKLSKTSVFAFVLGLLLIGTQSAFTAIEKLDPPADGWYEVTVINPLLSHSDPTNLAIGSITTEPAEFNEEGCAREDNEGDLCTVLLTFDEDATVVPAKISDVDSDFETIDDDAEQPL